MIFMKSKYFQIAFLMFVAGLSRADQPLPVSLVQLIATPERYNGKFVHVSGYLHNKFEDSGLYLTKEHADHLIGLDAVWVSYADEVWLQSIDGADIRSFDGKWVLLEGIVSYQPEHGHGHMGAFTAELKDVSRILERIQYHDGAKDVRDSKQLQLKSQKVQLN